MADAPCAKNELPSLIRIWRNILRYVNLYLVKQVQANLFGIAFHSIIYLSVFYMQI